MGQKHSTPAGSHKAPGVPGDGSGLDDGAFTLSFSPSAASVLQRSLDEVQQQMAEEFIKEGFTQAITQVQPHLNKLSDTIKQQQAEIRNLKRSLSTVQNPELVRQQALKQEEEDLARVKSKVQELERSRYKEPINANACAVERHGVMQCYRDQLQNGGSVLNCESSVFHFNQCVEATREKTFLSY